MSILFNYSYFYCNAIVENFAIFQKELHDNDLVSRRNR